MRKKQMQINKNSPTFSKLMLFKKLKGQNAFKNEFPIHSPQNYIKKNDEPMYFFKETKLARHCSEKNLTLSTKLSLNPQSYQSSPNKTELKGIQMNSSYAQPNRESWTVRSKQNYEKFDKWYKSISKNSNLQFLKDKKQKSIICTELSPKKLDAFSALTQQCKLSIGNCSTKKKVLKKQNFKLIKKLGQGKFGVVYLAVDITSGLIVALKIMKKKIIVSDKNLLNQLINQLKIQSFLQHPNIVSIYGYFHDRQNFYAIMQYAPTGQLYKVIQKSQSLSEEAISFICKKLLDTIKYLNKHNIIHRDIKPQNIVITYSDIKLCDFGWAVEKKQGLRDTFCGTPLYFSPQLLKGAKYDEKVDIWSIGVLAFELRFNQSPFQIVQKSQLQRIIYDQIHFPKYKLISKEFKQFICGALQKNPQKRFSIQKLLNSKFITSHRLQVCDEL